MTRMFKPAYILPAGILLASLACGGGSGSGGGSTAHGLVYTNPTSASQHFALVKDAASTSDTLVLDLIGPTDSSYQYAGLGVALSLQVDTTRASWGTLSNGNLFTQNGGTPLVWQYVNAATTLGVVSNKGLANTVSNLGTGVLAKIQVNLASGAPAGTVTLSDGGASAFVDSNGSEWPMVIHAGTLQVQ